MVLGDRNTSFYHVSAIARRKRNLITAIKNEVGYWLTKEREVATHIKEGFIKLYTTSQEATTGDIKLNQKWQVKLIDVEKESISHMVTDEEIFTAIWSPKAFKAPRPDGLHAEFFQRFWHIMRGSVREEVKYVFRERKVPDYLNRTNIVLIPKNQGPESISNFRPISLCNLVYKIVSKIIVSRIRSLLNHLISPSQATFVPGRRGVDNAIIVQEIIHIMGKAKRNVGYMALKIDLEKAYDKLEWSFIKGMLSKFNFPENLIKLMMSCISSISTSILFNGGSLDSFLPTRGIRQGDPLSPYIFILYIELLD